MSPHLAIFQGALSFISAHFPKLEKRVQQFSDSVIFRSAIVQKTSQPYPYISAIESGFRWWQAPSCAILRPARQCSLKVENIMNPNIGVNAGLQHFLIVDNHPVVLEGLVCALQKQFPQAQIMTAHTATTAAAALRQTPVDLIIMELRLPEAGQAQPSTSVGMRLLTQLMGLKPAQNFLVLSTSVRPLVRLVPEVNAHAGGFMALEKTVPIPTIFEAINTVLRGSVHLPPSVQPKPEFHSRWLQMIELKYKSALSDRAIAKKMELSDRTIRNYWMRIQDALGIQDDPDKDVRVQIQIAARNAGLIE